MLKVEIIPVISLGFFIFSLKTTSDVGAVKVDTRCPEPFVYLAHKCFWFFGGMEIVDRKQASAKCEAAEARLAHINDELTQEEVTKWIKSYEYRLMSYWIGLSDPDGNGQFRWDEKSSDAIFTSWGKGQPDPESNNTCVVIASEKFNDWEAVNCAERNLFICEKEIEPSQIKLLRSATSDQFCYFRQLGYYPDPDDCRKYILCFGKKIFRYSCPKNEVFDYVRLLCGREGFGTFCNTEPEIITTDFPTADVTESPEYNDCEYYEEYGDCVEREAGEDNLDNGDNDEKEVEQPISEDFSNYICEDSSYFKLGKNCFKIFSNPVSWDAANQICIGDERGRLATIRSVEVQRFIVKKLKRNIYPVYDFWIGLNDQKTPDTYVWSDGSVLTDRSYQNWSRRARKRHRHLKKCVEMAMLSKGRWQDDICANENGYICEKEAGNASSLRGLSRPDRVDVWKSRPSFCGMTWRPGEPQAVVGGRTADTAEHPWQASLRSFGEHRCGGSLIDSCWVLTAAHCVDVKFTTVAKLPTLVVLGDVDTSLPEGDEKYLPVSEIVLHPQWTSQPIPTNDIALIKLEKCAVDVNPICLPGNENEFTSGDECKVAGWGTMDNTRSRYPSRLQEAVLPILAQDVCEKKYVIKRKTLIQDTMFCAGFLRGGTDACQGDSGGPLVCKGAQSTSRAVQWGIVSWGFECAMKDKPGVYTKVASYVAWIRNQTMINF